MGNRARPRCPPSGSARTIIRLGHSGISLPNRDYYLAGDSSTVHIRREYRKHVAAMFRLLGEPLAGARASSAAVLRIETALAQRSRMLEQLRDPYANYHKRSQPELAALTPALDWSAQFQQMKIGAIDSVIVGQPEFLTQADSLVRFTPLTAWKAYLRWGLVDALASRLSSPFELESFHFNGSVLSGTKAMRPRWKRVLAVEEDAIGELMGQVWVQKYCSPVTKARYEKLTEDIFSAYRDRIGALPWMSEATKQHALL